MHKKIQTEITQLMQKDMDRKDFIKHVGIGFVGITGIASAMKTLTQLNSSSTARHVSTGYGSSVYGGLQSRRRTN